MSSDGDETGADLIIEALNGHHKRRQRLQLVDIAVHVALLVIIVLVIWRQVDANSRSLSDAWQRIDVLTGASSVDR